MNELEEVFRSQRSSQPSQGHSFPEGYECQYSLVLFFSEYLMHKNSHVGFSKK